MPEQLLHRRTVFGWLAILAAFTSTGTDHAGISELLDTVSFPIAVIDLGHRCVVATSPRMRSLLGVDTDSHGMDLRTLVQNETNLTALLSLLAGGSIDGYQAFRSLRGHARSFQAWSWVCVCDYGSRNQALWVIAPAGEDPGQYLAEPTPSAWPTRVDGLVMTTLDAEWRIERVSVDVTPILGYIPGDIVGSSFVGLVHPDDVAALVDAAARAVVDRAGVGVQLRVRQSSGEWLQGDAIFTLLADTALRFGCALAVPARRRRTDSMWVDNLERRLWRIAREVEDAGIFAGFDAVPDQRVLPALGELAPRQWEVLSRLLRGERVPTIAANMYVSQSTVRNHLAEIYRKVGVHSQHELLELVRSAARGRARGRTNGPPAPDDFEP